MTRCPVSRGRSTASRRVTGRGRRTGHACASRIGPDRPSSSSRRPIASRPSHRRRRARGRCPGRGRPGPGSGGRIGPSSPSRARRRGRPRRRTARRLESPAALRVGADRPVEVRLPRRGVHSTAPPARPASSQVSRRRRGDPADAAGRRGRSQETGSEPRDQRPAGGRDRVPDPQPGRLLVDLDRGGALLEADDLAQQPAIADQDHLADRRGDARRMDDRAGATTTRPATGGATATVVIACRPARCRRPVVPPRAPPGSRWPSEASRPAAGGGW